MISKKILTFNKHTIYIQRIDHHISVCHKVLIRRTTLTFEHIYIRIQVTFRLYNTFHSFFVWV